MYLKDEFIQILTKYGHNVYLQRRNTNVGSGPTMKVDAYSSTLEKWTVWRTPLRAGASASADSFMKLDDEGLYSNYDVIYYFQPESNVKSSDKIIEPTPNERKERHVLLVKKAIPYYFDNTMIYIACYSDRIDPVNS